MFYKKISLALIILASTVLAVRIKTTHVEAVNWPAKSKTEKNGNFNPFSHVGAISPSSKSLAKAITKKIWQEMASRPNGLTILEIGAGNGVFTAALEAQFAKHKITHYTVYAVDIDPTFITALKKRFAHNPRIKIVAIDISSITSPEALGLASGTFFDIIISGLPFYADCFSPENVEKILTNYIAFLKPDGLLRWFSYIGISKIITTCLHSGALASRRYKVPLSSFEHKCRIINKFKNQQHAISKPVFSNLPPAWVHECRAPGK